MKRMYIAPANAYMEGEDILIAPDWLKGLYPDKPGNYAFTFEEIARFNSDPDNVSVIDNMGELVSFGGHDDWRVPSVDEYKNIFLTAANRSGSALNGNKSVHYCWVKFEYPRNFSSSWVVNNVIGLLAFPDDKSLSGADVSYYDNDYINNLSYTDVDNFMRQGCAFIPSYTENNVDYRCTYGHITFDYTLAPGQAIVSYSSGGLDKWSFYLRLVRNN